MDKMNIIKLLLVLFCALILTVSICQSYPSPQRKYLDFQDNEERDLISEISLLLQRELEAEELRKNSKRGLDLGLARGFSGSQQAKHLMGLAAAKYPQGPGRK